MRLYQVRPFVSWMLMSAVRGVGNMHDKYKHLLRYDTIIALLFWLILSVMGFLFAWIAAILISEYYMFRETAPPYMFGIAIGYLVYTGISVQYEIFLEERARLFDELKK